MYCSRCGSEIPDDAMFCGSCGSETEYSRSRIAKEYLDPSTAALYSLLIIGGGQMYIGNMRRGVVFLLCAVLATVFLGVSVMTATVDDSMELILLMILAALLFTTWIVNIFDAYNQAKLYNIRLIDTGEISKRRQR